MKLLADGVISTGMRNSTWDGLLAAAENVVILFGRTILASCNAAYRGATLTTCRKAWSCLVHIMGHGGTIVKSLETKKSLEVPKMRFSSSHRFSLLLPVLAIVMAVPFSASAVRGAEQAQAGGASGGQPEAGITRVGAGQKLEIKGIILKRDPDNLTVRDFRGSEYVVKLTDTTEVKERKSNPFRRAKNYAATQLMRGLNVEVEGRGDSSGDLVADTIKMRDDDLRVANNVESRMEPVEGRLSETETRLSQSEQNAERLSGQVQELQAISNAARGGAKAAQETADAANVAANAAAASANEAKEGVAATNERISALDEFEVKGTTVVLFKGGSATLTDEAKSELDIFAEDVQRVSGYLIEVAGFASSDGSEELNRRLSQRRADAVIRYLAENYSIPLRRFITPFGYGEKNPVGDNSTREGRTENRRVELKILVNKGLTKTSSTGSSS